LDGYGTAAGVNLGCVTRPRRGSGLRLSAPRKKNRDGRDARPCHASWFSTAAYALFLRERRQTARKYGAAEFVTKPVDFDLLKQQLQQLRMAS